MPTHRGDDFIGHVLEIKESPDDEFATIGPMHPFFRIFLTMLITSVVAAVFLNLLFRDGDETDRALERFAQPSFFDRGRGKFGFFMAVVGGTAVGSFKGLPLLWEYVRSHFLR